MNTTSATNAISSSSTAAANNNYKKPDLKDWLHCFSTHVNAELLNDSFEYPEHFAKGYARVHVLEPGLSYRLVNYKMNTDVEHNCEPSDEFNILIYFYQLTSCNNIIFEVGNNVIENDKGSYKAVLMTNSTVKQKLHLKKGTEVRGLTIQLSRSWLDDKIKCTEHKNNIIEKDFLQEVIRIKFQKILDDIYNHEDSSIPGLYINTRVLRLLEGFLENFFKRNAIEPMLSILSKDFESILKIESLLLENYGEAFPKIEKLARIALMSESKLKKIYKQAFGMGLYEYYQKNRMHKAKELLTSGAYTVSQVGSMLGYHNLSNFSSSFKKEFNKLPREYHQVG